MKHIFSLSVIDLALKMLPMFPLYPTAVYPSLSFVVMKISRVDLPLFYVLQLIVNTGNFLPTLVCRYVEIDKVLLVLFEGFNNLLYAFVCGILL